ncbi:DUF1285 domain-containing protein [Teichococcus vastitatis]|jgi:hypothetical protein|uniref:DUF1285 domain-containing protein n=1 Tax=Teichococcus vastitatis TaxID=2307076 RepID=A0ABS9VZ55_9PROT|nr:DUF1285 domain-containing protein [Pseudoroseomonas vastitatis]MCI0752269.1 DUF1285 domain-containing protein [Pseudoroseomonas vastitatis]
MPVGRVDEALKQSGTSQDHGQQPGQSCCPSQKKPPRPAAPNGRPKRDCGDFQMRIARDGSWHYKGSPIGRKELVCLFSSVLRREPDGSYWLETPVERGRIEVEDAPFVAVEVFWRRCEGRQCLTFRTNLDEMVTADADHPIRVTIDPRTRQPRPYVMVRPGLEARINRAVFYELVALAEPESLAGRETLGVWSEGVFFPIDEVPSDSAVSAAAE